MEVLSVFKAATELDHRVWLGVVSTPLCCPYDPIDLGQLMVLDNTELRTHNFEEGWKQQEYN